MKEDDRAVVGWISPLNFWTRHQDLQRTRTEGTGEWILDSPLVSKWLSGEEKVIWCHGMRTYSSTNTFSGIDVLQPVRARQSLREPL